MRDGLTDLELCALADEGEGGVDDAALAPFHRLRRHLRRAEALDVVDPLGTRRRAAHLLGLSEGGAETRPIPAAGWVSPLGLTLLPSLPLESGSIGNGGTPEHEKKEAAGGGRETCRGGVACSSFSRGNTRDRLAWRLEWRESS